MSYLKWSDVAPGLAGSCEPHGVDMDAVAQSKSAKDRRGVELILLPRTDFIMPASSLNKGDH